MILFVAAKEDDARLLIQMLLLSFAALLKPSAATLLFVCITNLLPYLPSSTLLFNALRARAQLSFGGNKISTLGIKYEVDRHYKNL